MIFLCFRYQAPFKPKQKQNIAETRPVLTSFQDNRTGKTEQEKQNNRINIKGQTEQEKQTRTKQNMLKKEDKKKLKHLNCKML